MAMEIDRCRDLEEHLEEYAVGLADHSVGMRIQVHLAEGCSHCAQRIEERMVRFHTDVLAEEPGFVPEDLGEKVLAAIASCPQEQPEPVIVYPESNERRLLWILLALAVAMVAAVAWWASAQRVELAAAQRQARIFEQATSRNAEQTEVLQSMLSRLTDPRVAIVDLHGSGESFAAVRARVMCDLQRAELTLRVLSLPPPEEGQVYSLWLGERGNERLLGSLLPQIVDRSGTSKFRLPKDLVMPFRLSLSRQARSSMATIAMADEVVFSSTLAAPARSLP